MNHIEFFRLTASSPQDLREVAADYLLDQGDDLGAEVLRSNLFCLGALVPPCDSGENHIIMHYGWGYGHAGTGGNGDGSGGCGGEPRNVNGAGVGDGLGYGQGSGDWNR